MASVGEGPRVVRAKQGAIAIGGLPDIGLMVSRPDSRHRANTDQQFAKPILGASSGEQR